MAKIDLSIIIVSYNTRDLLINCIRSVIKFNRNITYEIIVVDNDSKDKSIEGVKKEFKNNKNITYIANKSNVGFAEANNQGFEKAKGNFVLLLNSDTYFTKEIFPHMFKCFEDENVGIASSKLLNADLTIQPSGGYFPTPLRLLCWLYFIDDVPFISRFIKSFHPKPSFFASSHEQDWVTGAFFLIRKECLKDVGNFSIDYFMYTEEMDFCYRAKLKGWTVWYEASHSIVHLGQASGSSEYALTQEMHNVRLFIKKYMPSSYPLVFILVKTGTLFRALVFAILGRIAKAKVYAHIYGKTQYSL